MPITRRRRANPPDQPENNNHLADHLENATETLATEHSAEFSQADREAGAKSRSDCAESA